MTEEEITEAIKKAYSNGFIDGMKFQEIKQTESSNH
jgi:hypothetical protein